MKKMTTVEQVTHERNNYNFMRVRELEKTDLIKTVVIVILSLLLAMATVRIVSLRKSIDRANDQVVKEQHKALQRGYKNAIDDIEKYLKIKITLDTKEAI